MSGRPRAAAVLLALVPLAAGVARAESFTFERLNRVYEGVVDELAPVEMGPALVQLRSPEHALTIRRHLADLAPTSDGDHRIRLELAFSGWGRLEADVTLGTVTSRLNDDVVVPAQSVVLDGRARVARTEGGYLITPTELPRAVNVRIESRLARRLFSLCRPMGLVLVNLDCAALEAALSSIDVPLPDPGQAYLLPDAELTDADRERLDGYLAAIP
ncbi:MAG TPA: hypothetical protein VMV46_10840 [Thermoanaerobaculia bacterium]|nr:hypothetical protein [Thermoanaerobaculia bacterium]